MDAMLYLGVLILIQHSYDPSRVLCRMAITISLQCVTLSNDLELSKHIATMTNKANSKLWFLRRNLKGCPDKLK